jgi:hypothetical protein
MDRVSTVLQRLTLINKSYLFLQGGVPALPLFTLDIQESDK